MWIPLSIAAVLIAAAIFLTQVKVVNLKFPAVQGVQMKYVWYVAIGLAGILVFTLVGKYVLANGSEVDTVFWVSVLIVIALAVLGVMGKGGAPAKWAFGFVGTFVIAQVLFGFAFGEKSGTVAEKLRGEVVSAVLSDEPKSTTSAVQVPVQTPTQDNWYGKEHVITITRNVPMKPLKVTEDRCFRAWGADPDGNAFTTYVRDVNEKGWTIWDEYRKKYPGRGFGWVRFEPTSQEAEVHYAFYNPGECD